MQRQLEQLKLSQQGGQFDRELAFRQENAKNEDARINRGLSVQENKLNFDANAAIAAGLSSGELTPINPETDTLVPGGIGITESMTNPNNVSLNGRMFGVGKWDDLARRKGELQTDLQLKQNKKLYELTRDSLIADGMPQALASMVAVNPNALPSLVQDPIRMMIHVAMSSKDPAKIQEALAMASKYRLALEDPSEQMYRRAMATQAIANAGNITETIKEKQMEKAGLMAYQQVVGQLRQRNPGKAITPDDILMEVQTSPTLTPEQKQAIALIVLKNSNLPNQGKTGVLEMLLGGRTPGQTAQPTQPPVSQATQAMQKQTGKSPIPTIQGPIDPITGRPIMIPALNNQIPNPDEVMKRQREEMLKRLQGLTGGSTITPY